MKNVQIKTTELNEKRFVGLFEKSNTTTKGEFLNQLMQAYEKPAGSPADQELIEALKKECQELKEKNGLLQAMSDAQLPQIKDVAKEAALNATPKGAIILDFKPEFRKYFWGVNEVCKKMNYSLSYEELIENVFTICYKRGELVLDKDDCAWLDGQKYDIDETEGSNGK
jgi:hypothetical protein